MARYRLDPRIEQLELAFDSGDLDETKSRKAWPKGFDLVEAFARRRWNEVYPRAEELFADSDVPAEKAFALQWAMAAAEAEFDLARRTRYLHLWDEVEGWQDDPYCRYLRAYHLGLTHFFGGALPEAEACFQLGYVICDAAEYPRGMIRMLFHLGLVERERGQISVAIEHFQHARVLASERKAGRWLSRIEKELETARAALEGKSSAPAKTARSAATPSRARNKAAGGGSRKRRSA